MGQTTQTKLVTYFYGSCTLEQLASFSRDVIGIQHSDKLPKNNIVMPISVMRQRFHRVYCEQGQIIEPPRVMGFRNILVGIYEHTKISKAKWKSKRKNILIVQRTNDNEFILKLEQVNRNSNYHYILTKLDIKLTHLELDHK